MTGHEFDTAFGGTGIIKLGAWTVSPAPADMVACQATLAFDDRIVSLSATATGPVGAMTSILHDVGAPVQIISLRQRETDDGITAFLLCERDNRQVWVYGNGTTSDEANVNALVAGANRLR
ncbi:MAG: hypothetical protein QM662_03100 [Gordonia sp. (in: high G+C Gram-positive bacteria)]